MSTQASRVRHFLFSPNGSTAPGEQNALAANPLRNLIYIQNTGATTGNVRFTVPCEFNGGDLEIAPGETLKFDNAVPIATLYLGGTTTFSVLEGTITERKDFNNGR